jgi:uroporphyrin-3 C-methyltransferase
MTSEGSKTPAEGDGEKHPDAAAETASGQAADAGSEASGTADRAKRGETDPAGAPVGDDQPPLSAPEAAAVLADTPDNPPPPAPPRAPRWPGFVALIALLLAVIGAVLGGWTVWRGGDVPAQPLDAVPRAAAADLDAARERIDTLAGEIGQIDGVSSSLAELRGETRDLERAIQSVRSDFAERVDLLDSLPGRVRNVESGLSTLQGISVGTRNAWLVAEAEYYMQIANAQIQLANNPELAAVALELADQRVRELADPSYTAVRRELADEIQRLNAIEKTDIEGVTLQLASLASVIPGLPLSNRIDVPGGKAPAPDESQSGFDRVVDSVGSAFGSMVRIRETDEQVKPLLSPQAEYFLRQNLQLQLQAARLALLLGAEESYRQSIADASDWLRDYFDTDAAPVRAAQQTLDDIMEQDFSVERPDISGSLELLRQQVKLEALGE